MSINTTSGSEIFQRIIGKTGVSRELIISDAIIYSKETPYWQETFLPVHEHGQDRNNDDIIIEYMVSADYLSVGNDMDYLRMPLPPYTAQKIADSLNCLLPTKHMVDSIYKAAAIKLSPQTYRPKIGEPGAQDSRAFDIHNKNIQTQIGNQTVIGLLVAGDKKDVVVTNQLLDKPKKVAIYGWHQKNGNPIQPLFCGHGDFYYDYSHGIRLISKKCRINGIEHDLEEVLKSQEYGPILTGADPLKFTKYPY